MRFRDSTHKEIILWMIQNMTTSANVWQSGGYDKYAKFCTVYQSYAALGNLQALHIYWTNLSWINITRFCIDIMLLVHGQVYIPDNKIRLSYSNDLLMALIYIYIYIPCMDYRSSLQG